MSREESDRIKRRIDWLEIWARGAEGRGNHRLARELREERAGLVFTLAAALFVERELKGAHA